MPRPGTLLVIQRAFALTGRCIGGAACVLASALVVVMSVILFLQVVFRYVLMLPLPWSEEAARFCLVWFAMLASCVAGQRGLHFAIRWGVKWLNPWVREAARILILAFGAGVLLFLAFEGFSYLAIVSTLTATATRINMTWVYAAIPVGCIGLAIIHLVELADAVLAPFTDQHLGIWRHTEDLAFSQLHAAED